MVVDTSALVAVVAEPDGPGFFAALAGADAVAISAVTMYETRVVLTGRFGGRPRHPAHHLDSLLAILARLAAEVVPFEDRQVLLAHRAYLRYGRGFHEARLNFADCAAYALAKFRGEPLLFKGDDFARTDVERVV